MESSTSYIRTKSVKLHLKEEGLRMSHNVPTQLDIKVYQIIELAAKRAKRNNRSTVMPHDL